MVKKIPLRKLNASWTPGSARNHRLGLEFDCPSCDNPHRLQLGLNDPPRWLPAAVYRYAGDTTTAITLAPIVTGSLHSPSCAFRGWVKLGHVEMPHLQSRRVVRWENMDFDHEPRDY